MICGWLWVRLIKILNYMDVNYVKKWFVLWMGGYLWRKMRRNNVKAEPVIQLSFYFNELIYVCPYCCYSLGYVTESRTKRVESCPKCGQPLLWGDDK